MSRTPYRNITVDPGTGTRIIDYTAEAILDTVAAAPGTRVPVTAIDAAVIANGGRLKLKAAAIKGLRNGGWAITTRRARHLSWYMLDAMPVDYQEQRQLLVQEMYSRQVTICREFAGRVAALPADPTLAITANQAQLVALTLGTDTAVGKTIPEVILDLAPLP